MLRKVAAKALWLTRGAALFGGAVVTLALVFGVATMALGANGGNLILGQTNTATLLTQLTGNVDGSAMKVHNTNPDLDDQALNLQVQDGEAPMRVNSDGRVVNLNADKLDNKDANGLIRVASFNGDSPLPDGQDGTVATTNITAPAPGFLVITAGSDLFNFDQFDKVTCFIEVDGTQAPGSEMIIDLNGDAEVNEEEDCSTNAVVAVSAGQHAVDLEADVGRPGTKFDQTALSAIYVPFGSTGAPPSQAAISAAQDEREIPAQRR